MRFPFMSINLLVLAGGMALTSATAYAQTNWHVDDDACPGLGLGTESDPFCSIQTAIDTATDGDEVVVRPGTYLENINYLGKAITVRSSDPEDPDTVASTVIDGRGAQEEDTFGSVVTFINGETSNSLLNGLTLRGGIGRKGSGNRYGGAVYVNDASPTINNCLLTNNTATSGGGLFCIDAGNGPVISNCTISSNASRRGGGIFSSAGSSPQITRCWILGNASEIDGGALSCSGGSPIIRNCIIAGNVARWGGALSLVLQGTVTVYTSTIVANEASFEGGAISLNNSSATFRNCISWGNTASSGPEFRLWGAVLSVDYCDVQGGQEAVELGNNSTLLWGVGNIDTDPLFLGTQPRNEHLSIASPCVNAGDPLFVPAPGEKDIDGDERVINLIVDMGADEHNPDCNGNGIPDEEDIANGASIDCNNNGVPDECLHLEVDCNENTLPDECDIETGDSEDCNGNGVPDECLYLEIDCNENAVPDECDIDQGTSDDCNDNGQPDDCEPDCNTNGVSDECDISDGSSEDCDLNGVPDDCGPDCNNNGTLDLCDISEGTSEDCSGNEIPDECEPDCNSNGQADSCDIESGLSEDVNRSGVPDECEPRVTMYVDDDATGQPVQDGTIENPFATIGQALDAAPADQALVEVVVADGIYVGNGNKNLDFGGKILTLRSVNGPQSTIIDCQGAGRGFSFINFETRDAILDGFTIKHGRARHGGAIQCRGFSNPTIRNCILIGNISDQLGKGGGLYATSSSPLITHCSIIGNIAESTGRGGGGIFIVGYGDELQPSIENSLIVGNTAYQGGGIWTSGGLSIRNCTIARNTAANQGGGIYVPGFALVTVSNCVFWGNTAAVGSEIYLRDQNAALSASYSDIQGGQAGVEGPGTLIWEAGNIAADPLFVDADQGDYHLLAGSPAIDAGDNTAVPPDVSDLDGDGDASEPIPFDLDGRPRFLNELDTPDTGNPDGVHAIVDMGPYEIGQPGCPDLDDDGQVTICHAPPGNPDNTHTMTVSANVAAAHLAHGDTCGPCGPDGCVGNTPPDMPEGQTVWYVDDDSCPESGTGSQADPFCKIQDGIIAADHGDVVLVAAGAYFENFQFMGKAITVQSWYPTDSDTVACTIIDASLDGEGGGSVVAFAEGENSDSVLQGFTITQGLPESIGSGISCFSGSDPTIANCVISGNSAPQGGGIRLNASSPTISDCTIIQNLALIGGGMWVGAGSNPVISNCSFSDNFGIATGGGMYTLGNTTVTGSLFSGNTTGDGSGAAICNRDGGVLVVSDCVFSNNSTNSTGFGGGICNEAGSQMTASNCVFEGNQARWGGGIYSYFESQVAVSNCLFQDNVAKWGGGIRASSGSSMTLTNCTFRHNTASDGSGGGVLSEWIDLVATNCVFEGNIASVSDGGAQQSWVPSNGNGPASPDSTRRAATVTLGYGGGLSVVDGHASVTNCLFIGNIGRRGGAVSCSSDSSVGLAHCTISGNHAEATGGGVYLSGAADLTLDNCILWNDTAPEGPEILIYPGPGTLAVGYSDIEGGQEGIEGGGPIIWGEGNIDADPLFVDPFGGDYRLFPGSPCIDAADNLAVPPDSSDLDSDGDTDEPVPIDLDGAPRFADDLVTPDSGNPDGIYPIVDMGAYEFEGSACWDEDGDGQVTICHLPGSSGNPQTMSVNQNNLPAHLAHGDSCGPCAEDDGAPPDEGGNGETEASACPADVDGDSAVSAADLALLLGSWGPCADPNDCPADLDGDGAVGPLDLAILLGNWGPCG